MGRALTSSDGPRLGNLGRIGWRTALGICIVLAALLRAFSFPQGLSPCDVDEPGYLADGLLVAEGITPAHKYAPSGPLTWFGFVYTGVRALICWLSGQADVSSFPWMLRPVAALEATLFGVYADMSSLRVAAVSLIAVLSLISVAAACRSGQALGGIPGAIISGLLAASTPLYVDLATQARPYSIAWSFALVAFAAATLGGSRRRTLLAGVFLGLAVGSHVDMARIAPFIFLVRWRQAGSPRPPWRDFGAMIVAAVITFVLIAPWYLLHLMDNLRQILTVRILRPELSGAAMPWVTWWNAGFVTPLIITIVGLCLPPLRRNAPVFLCGLWLIFNAAIGLFPSSHGLHHDGALLVAVTGLAPISVARLSDEFAELQKPIGVGILIVVAVVPTLWKGVAFSLHEARARDPDAAIAWIERNVPSGGRVYVDGGGIASLLPTFDAAKRLWNDVAAPDAWLLKYVHDTTNFGFGDARPLRVMSDDRMAADYGGRRRYAILGAPLQLDRPRYDLWIVSDGSFFDVSTVTVVHRLCSEGGIYVHNGTAVPNLPVPVVSWIRPDGNSTYIYRVLAGTCSAASAAP